MPSKGRGGKKGAGKEGEEGRKGEGEEKSKGDGKDHTGTSFSPLQALSLTVN